MTHRERVCSTSRFAAIQAGTAGCTGTRSHVHVHVHAYTLGSECTDAGGRASRLRASMRAFLLRAPPHMQPSACTFAVCSSIRACKYCAYTHTIKHVASFEHSLTYRCTCLCATTQHTLVCIRRWMQAEYPRVDDAVQASRCLHAYRMHPMRDNSTSRGHVKRKACLFFGSMKIKTNAIFRLSRKKLLNARSN